MADDGRRPRSGARHGAGSDTLPAGAERASRAVRTRGGALRVDPITLHADEAPEIQAFLAQRIYEFNSKATGYFDGESFSGTRRDESGAIRAGICGYTWGGCAYVSYLWVDESERGHGLGTALLFAAEQHAKTKGCNVVFLATHSFQAPSFYERMDYKRQAVVQDHPMGHASLVYAKRLQPNGEWQD